ncbi:hypothetical protein GCM10009569_13210 [Arthrobacter russicus]
MRKIYAATGIALAVGLLCTTQFAGVAQAADPSAGSIDPANVITELSSQGNVEQIIFKSAYRPAQSALGRSSQASTLATGLKDLFASAPGSEFTLDAASTNSIKRFTQNIAGVPVLGSSLTQLLDGQGAITSAIGSVTRGSKGSFPVDPAAGQAAALATATRVASVGKDAAAVTLNDQKAIWFDGVLVGKAAKSSVAVPAYQFKFSTGFAESRVLTVAANGGAILDDRTDRKDINRVVCDANSKIVDLDASNADAMLKCGKTQANKPTRIEGQAASSVADVNSVYNFLNDTSSFYAANTKASDLTSLIGNDEGDGLGKAMRAVVRICVKDSQNGTQCPFANAFWYNGQMTYGQGVTTDDVTGHELTHGVTEATNGLVYAAESGAINESMSDVFGEFIDLSNGSSDDTAANRWKIGEGSSLGVIRDMKSPGSYGDPSIYKGSNWKSTANPSDANDQGGVHSNSGVGNKLAFLITDGQTFNGQTVSGIGIAKAAQLYWSAQVLLTSNATYATLGKALNTACQNNVANNVAGTTAANCTQVANAVKAVGIK